MMTIPDEYFDTGRRIAKLLGREGDEEVIDLVATLMEVSNQADDILGSKNATYLMHGITKMCASRGWPEGAQETE
jgi:hypothetical protein